MLNVKRCRYSLLCGKPPFEASDGTLEGTYANIDQDVWTFEKTPDHPHQIHTPHHPPSPEARDLITKLLCHDYKERATIETIERHPFMGVRLPSRLPISALRVPPFERDVHDTDGKQPEPRLMFVCLEATFATRPNRVAPLMGDNRARCSKQMANPRSVSRWRCCVAGAPDPLIPPAGSSADGGSDVPTTNSDSSTESGAAHTDDERLPIRVRVFQRCSRNS